MWFDSTKLLFVKFNDAEFFFPWAGLLVGAFWGFLISTVPLGRFLRCLGPVWFYLNIAIGLSAVAVGVCLHSWGAAAIACVLPNLIRGLLMVLILRRSPRLPARMSFHLYARHLAEQIGEYGLSQMEMQSLMMSLMSFAMAACNLAPAFSAVALGFAIFTCANAVFVCLARTEIYRERTTVD